MRDYNALVSAVIHAIPTREEIQALSTDEIENLRKLGNTFDNQLYLEIIKRRESAAKS